MISSTTGKLRKKQLKPIVYFQLLKLRKMWKKIVEKFGETSDEFVSLLTLTLFKLGFVK